MSEVEELRVIDTLTGRCKSPDELIAPWCVENRKVLVTMDEDFRGRLVRSGLLAGHGLEVIVFDRDIKGAPEQHARVTYHLPHWEHTLGLKPYQHRVWIQSSKRKEPKEQAKLRP